MSGDGGASRRRSRQVALQVLYALDLASASGRGAAAGASEATPPPSPEDLFTDVSENFELPRGACAFARELVEGVTGDREDLDALLSEHATNWRLSRMAAVDRNILRIGAYELTHSDTPAQVVLDEAIELARRFGDDPSPAFVNGVLDSIASAVRGGLVGRRGSPGCG